MVACMRVYEREHVIGVGVGVILRAKERVEKEERRVDFGSAGVFRLCALR